MSARIKPGILLFLGMCLLPLSLPAAGAAMTPLDKDSLAEQLGWAPSTENNCGGYYLEPAFTYPDNDEQNNNAIQVTGSQALFSQHGTTVLEGKVSLMRFGQQITANKAYLYRDPATGKIASMDLLGNVHLREPNTLVVAKRGHYDFSSRNKTLMEILYRTSLNTSKQIVPTPSKTEIQQERKITSLTAWGKADEFSQTEPRVYELYGSSFSTCPPTSPAWRVKASHIVLNKNTGRGYATHARIFVKNIPVLYIPYLNFSIDHQRKSGFLWPTVGNKPNQSNTYSGWGPYFLTPFYWNMAPNYDMTITPGMLVLRGVRITDKFRYLSSIGRGTLDVGILPGDREFADYQLYAARQYTGSSAPTTQAELQRLLTSNTTRKSISWRDDTIFNDHWSTHVDFNYAGDDYYLRDFGSDLSDQTQNQILQEGDLYYKGQNWNFIGRLQTYQTLHPISASDVLNQYRRFPQLVLSADYPDQALGLEYFLGTEATHFSILNTPGTAANQPMGNRLHLQPGISLPMYWPYFFINPRLQVSMTNYNLYQTAETQTPSSAQRTIPIFDMAVGFALNRNMTMFGKMFQQTLEPQVYYTYIPYRNQTSIQIFDTTVSTLTYDQIFNYNRFIGIDRIGDANQVGVGVSSRILDSETGLEKVRMGVGGIVYFSTRKVTFCNDTSCVDNPFNRANHWRLSPISGLISYAVNPVWSLEANAIASPISKQLGNSTIGLHYRPDEKHIINLGYGYVFNQDPNSGGITNSAQDNLKLTDFSFSWPLSENMSAVGQWSQNWNQQHLQNMIYGLQYDTCCWAMRIVGGRAFIGLDPNQNNAPKYNPDFYIQFALKGLGNIGTDPSGLLKSITGYNTQFGQEF